MARSIGVLASSTNTANPTSRCSTVAPHRRASRRLPLARIPGRAPNVFFSLLRPGRRIPPHTGVTNTRAIVHLPSTCRRGAASGSAGRRANGSRARAFAFDDTIEHEAWNDSDRRRAVLILDGWNPHLSEAERETILAYFAASDRELGSLG